MLALCLRALLIALSFVAAAPAAAQTTVTMMQGVNSYTGTLAHIGGKTCTAFILA